MGEGKLTRKKNWENKSEYISLDFNNGTVVINLLQKTFGAEVSKKV